MLGWSKQICSASGNLSKLLVATFNFKAVNRMENLLFSAHFLQSCHRMSHGLEVAIFGLNHDPFLMWIELCIYRPRTINIDFWRALLYTI